MQNITNKLTCKVELWGMVHFKNELNECDEKEDKIKDVFCNILPINASEKVEGVVDSVEYSHKFTIRSKSILDIKQNMFFIHKNFKYQFKYWNPDFKNNEFVEIFTKLVLE